MCYDHDFRRFTLETLKWTGLKREEVTVKNGNGETVLISNNKALSF